MDTHAAIRSALDDFDIPQARQLLRDALRDSPDAELYYLASLVAVSPQQKIEFLQQACGLDPFHPEAVPALQAALAGPPPVTPPQPPRPAPAAEPTPPTTQREPFRMAPLPMADLPPAPAVWRRVQPWQWVLGAVALVGVALMVRSFSGSAPVALSPAEKAAFDAFHKLNAGTPYTLTFREPHDTKTCITIDPPLKDQTAFILYQNQLAKTQWLVHDPRTTNAEWVRIGCDRAHLAATSSSATAWQMLTALGMVTPSPKPTATPTRTPRPTATPTRTPQPTRSAPTDADGRLRCTPDPSLPDKDIYAYRSGDVVTLDNYNSFLVVLVTLPSDSTRLRYQIWDQRGLELIEGDTFVVLRDPTRPIDQVFIATSMLRTEYTIAIESTRPTISGNMGSICLSGESLESIISKGKQGTNKPFYVTLDTWYQKQ